jgi:hypothetical protein
VRGEWSQKFRGEPMGVGFGVAVVLAAAVVVVVVVVPLEASIVVAIFDG